MRKIIVLGIFLLVSDLNAYPTRGGDLHIFTDMRGVPTELFVWGRKTSSPIEGEDLKIYKSIVGKKEMQLSPLQPIYLIIYKNTDYNSIRFAFSINKLSPCATGYDFRCGKLGKLKLSGAHWKIATRSGL